METSSTVLKKFRITPVSKNVGEDPPQLTFQIENTSVEITGVLNVLYVSKDLSYNKIDFQILLNTGSVSLTPATIVDPTDPPPESGSLFYWDMSALGLSADEFGKITFSADNWSFKTFPSQSVVGFSPKQSVTLGSGPGNGIDLTISDLQLTMPSQSTIQTDLMFYNVPTVTGPYASMLLSIQNQPDIHDKNLIDYMSAVLSNSDIINSYNPDPGSNPFALENSFILTLEPGPEAADIIASDATTFTVQFTYGNPGDKYGYGALTTIENAKNITITPESNADNWTITKNIDQQSISWTLTPPAGKPILGKGPQALVGFSVKQILTEYQPGPTAMIVSYQGIPGYASGAYTMTLFKIGHAVITSMDVTPNPVVVRADGTAEVTVSWSTNYATSLLLTANFDTQTVSGTSAQIKIDALTTQITLTANGQHSDFGNQDIQSKSIQALPAVNSFVGNPVAIYSQQGSHQSTFAWSVNTVGGEQVKISSTGNAFQGQFFDPSSQTNATITQAQMVTLTPAGVQNPITLTRNVNIYAFTPSFKSWSLPNGNPDGVAISPTAPFMVFSVPKASQVVAVDSTDFSVISTVSISNNPKKIVFSQDGALIIVTTDKGLTPILVDMSTGQPVLTPQQPIVVGSGTPTDVFITPDKTRLYVSLDMGSVSAGQVASYKASSGTVFVCDSSVEVGKSPKGLVVIPSGFVIYTANSASNSISAIPVYSDGKVNKFNVTTIPNVASGPCSLAIAQNGVLLIAACSSSNTVEIIDTKFNNNRAQLRVGKNPTAVKVTPSGSYAFVANSGDGTVSLVDVWGAASLCSVLTTIPTGGTPTGVAISQDGLQALISNTASTSFGLITLETFQLGANPISVGVNITNIEASSDGKTVYSWSNGLIPQSSLGIIAYDVQTKNLEMVVPSLSILDCCFSPNPATSQAFAVALNDSNLYVINTKTKNYQQLSLAQMLPNAKPYVVTPSGDGNTLFLVMRDNSTLKVTLLVLINNGSNWVMSQTVPLPNSTTAGLLLAKASPDGNTVLMIDSSNPAVCVVTKTNGKYAVAKNIVAKLTPQKVSIMPDGLTAYILNSSAMSHFVTVVNLSDLTTKQITIPQNYINLTAIVPSPDGAWLYASDANAGAVRIMDPKSLRIVQTVSLGSAQNSSDLAVLADGSAIYVANQTSQDISVLEQIQMAEEEHGRGDKKR